MISNNKYSVHEHVHWYLLLYCVHYCAWQHSNSVQDEIELKKLKLKLLKNPLSKNIVTHFYFLSLLWRIRFMTWRSEVQDHFLLFLDFFLTIPKLITHILFILHNPVLVSLLESWIFQLREISRLISNLCEFHLVEKWIGRPDLTFLYFSFFRLILINLCYKVFKA